MLGSQNFPVGKNPKVDVGQGAVRLFCRHIRTVNAAVPRSAGLAGWSRLGRFARFGRLPAGFAHGELIAGDGS